MNHKAQTRGNPLNIRWLGAVTGAAISLVPAYAHAQNAPTLNKALAGYSPVYSPVYPPGAPFASWLDMVSATQAAQPKWMTPLVTVTPRLEQEFRWDFYDQKNGTGTQGNGQRLISYGGPGGPRVEFIPAYDWEVILAAPPYVSASGPRGTGQGIGDWPLFLVKYRMAYANENNGDYIVTAFFQMSNPSGTGDAISNNVLVAQPTIAFGKGWGDFDIQSTVSVQVPVDSVGPKPKTGTTLGNFGDPFLWNTTFQYHFLRYFWPELEVNYEVWPNGIHAGLNQVMLTPGVIFGRFQIGNVTATRPANLVFGAGYQIAVTPNPVTHDNVVATLRITF